MSVLSVWREGAGARQDRLQLRHVHWQRHLPERALSKRLVTLRARLGLSLRHLHAIELEQHQFGDLFIQSNKATGREWARARATYTPGGALARRLPALASHLLNGSQAV